MSEQLTVSAFARAAGRDEKQVRRGVAKGTLIKDAQGFISSDQLQSGWLKPNRRSIFKTKAAATQLSATVRESSDNSSDNLSDNSEVVRGAGLELLVSEDELQSHLTDPYDRAAVALLPLTAYRIGAAAGLLAHEEGMSIAAANVFVARATTAAMEIAAMLLDEADVEPPPGFASWTDAPLFAPDRVWRIDWTKAATVDTDLKEPV